MRVKTASFDSFPESISTLFQIVTGDEWMTLMDDNAVEYPACTTVFAKSDDPSDSMYYYDGPTYSWGDCGLSGAYFVFPSFVIFCQSVLLNLVIGMILDNFSFITGACVSYVHVLYLACEAMRVSVSLVSVYAEHASKS